MAEKTIEVTAQVIEPEKELSVLYTPAVIQSNLDALSEFVDKQLEIYSGFTVDPEDEERIKQARNVCADINAIKKPIEAERKHIKNEYEAPLKAFEAEVKAITSKIDGAYRAIKDQVDEADAMFKENRRAHLEEEYVGVAGILADVIPFSAILDDKWLTRSKHLGVAEEELQEKAATALKGYETLLTKNLTHKDEVVKRYVETLDILAALQLEDELLEKDRQMEEFKAKQESLKATKPQPAPEPQKAAEKPVEPIKKPEPTPQPEKPIGGVLVWSLEMEFTGTREYAQKVADALTGLGITGSTIKAVRKVKND